MTSATWVDAIEDSWHERLQKPRSPRTLTVLYDPGCALCRRCRDWMLAEHASVRLEFVECTGSEARERYGDIPWLGTELVVVGDGGEVWAGSAAFIVCLWALTDWREWSYRLADSAFAPLAERFFVFVSARRKTLSSWLRHDADCTDGTCSLGRRPL
jgi:predicted DCC family thiol-disulfide oxidoreductase YuxK